MNDDKGFTIYCSRCGNEMNSNARYCMKCGNLNMDHPSNKNMEKFVKDRKETYMVSGNGGKFIQDSDAISLSLSNGARGLGLCFFINIIFYLLLIIFVSYSYYNNCPSMLDFLSSKIYVYYIYISLCFIYLYAYEQLYVKLGYLWWTSLIPIYNLYLLSRRIFNNSWSWILLFIPGIGMIYSLVLLYKIGKTFGKNPVFVILFSFVYLPWIGLGDSTYNGSMYLNNEELEKNYTRKKRFLIITLFFLIIGVLICLFQFI